MPTVNEDAILTTLRQLGQMTADKLASQLDIASSTARRNLAKLEASGVVRRVVITASPKTYGWAAVLPSRNEPEEEPGNPAADNIDALISGAFETEPERGPRPGCQEIDAMRAIYEELEPMDTAARHRVVRWICEKLELDVTF